MGKSVVSVSMDSVVGDIQQNTAAVSRILDELGAGEKTISLAVFPEMCLYGYDEFEEIGVRYTQDDIDSKLNQIADSCEKTGIDAVVGAPFISSKGVENALYYINRKKSITHVYSKVHLIEAEQDSIQAGNTYGICQTSLGPAGFLICWDSSFAEAARLYAEAGAKLLIVSAAWETPYDRQWELAACARAYDNSIPVIASNRVGRDGTATFFGESMLIDGMGNILAKTSTNQEESCMVEEEILFDVSARSTFGSQIEELRKETYTMKHMKFF